MARLGEQVDVYCGRCKVERYHTVAAIGDSGRIERIVCGYCQSSRKYRDPATQAKPRATSGSRATSRTKKEADISDMSVSARPYTPQGTFEKGDVIFHNKYGRGRVMEVRGDRFDAKFADGSQRTFLHKPG